MRLAFVLTVFFSLRYTESLEKSWTWTEQNQYQGIPKELDPEVGKTDEYLASPSELEESFVDLNSTVERVVDEIITSTREGRALQEYDEIYSDPNVQDALQKGDDGEARNVIKDRLCYLGLMQCDNGEQIEGKRPYISPDELVYAQPVAINPVGKPIPTIPLKGIRGGSYGTSKPIPHFSSSSGSLGSSGKYFSPNKFIPPQSGYQGKPPRRHYGPPPTHSRPFLGKPGLSGEIYAGPFSKPIGTPEEFVQPIEPDFPPYKFEQGEHHSAQHKDKRVEITVNAQGGTASSGVPTTGNVALEHVHHHYHHNIDGTIKPTNIANPLSVAAASVSTSSGLGSSTFNSQNSFAPFEHINTLNKPNPGSNLFGGSSYYSSSNANGLNIGSSAGTYDTKFGVGINSGYYGGQSVANYGSSSLGVNSFESVKPVSEHYGPGSYGTSGLYKKELDLNSVAHNHLQSGYADRFRDHNSQISDSANCICVPYEQCPLQDVIGRKNDLYLPLDPRNLKSDIEAIVDESDNNSTSNVVKDPIDTPSNSTGEAAAEDTDAVKRISKREVDVEKTNEDKPETRQFNGGFEGSPQICKPRHVCCRKPLYQQSTQAHRQCGTRNSQGINGRIKNPVYVDGDSEFGEYPWQVAILKKDPKESVYVCGGTLIDSLHIITAAHCVKTYTGFDLRVRLGEWDVNHDVEFYPYIERDIGSVHIHPEFYAGTLYNDIAILRMDKSIDWSKHPHISPACLPNPYDDYTGSRCWTTGWGKDAFGDFGKYQNILKEVDVPVIGNGICQRQLQGTRLGYDFKLHPGFICAGGEEGKDACKGDGGGPMVCEKGSTWQVVGVVSWGIGCGQNGVPGVYVKVAHYLDWIKQVTQRY